MAADGLMAQQENVPVDGTTNKGKMAEKQSVLHGSSSTALYCDICRNNEHALCRCPVTRQPKPVVQLVGQAVDALATFHIPHAPIQPTKKDTRYAKVTVIGEVMTEAELIGALRLSIKDNYEWEAQKKENSVFKVLFPTRTDLVRATRFNIGLENGATLKFEEYTEDEEYFGHALPVVWMRVLNLPTILREYVVLWALGTLFGVTQEVDIITTNANKFGRFAVAVLEPEAIPTRLDVIIGNRYFQLIFEVEPFQPNIGLIGRKTTANSNNDDKGNGAKKDSVMKEKDNMPDGAHGNYSSETNLNELNGNSMSGTNAKETENMEVDWEQDDLLHQEQELSEAASTFLGIKKGQPLAVFRASGQVSSPILSAKPMVEVKMADATGQHGTTTDSEDKEQQKLQENKVQTKEKAVDVLANKLHGVTTVRPPVRKGLITNKPPVPKASKNSAAAVNNQSKATASMEINQLNTKSKSQCLNSKEVDTIVSNKSQKEGKDGMATSGGGTINLGGLLDNMLGAGVTADGASNGSLGSKTVMAMLSPKSDGQLTPLRRSIRTAGDSDVDSVEKAGNRVAIKNLEEAQGYWCWDG
ncbi:unnamed protein product [Urochloa decumbens]|uniref:DUF4283 domain-containing protein n=1 Tax=Urochloa decumbens TaxID=240449 RepID=A0ABC9A1G1_9POAL